MSLPGTFPETQFSLGFHDSSSISLASFSLFGGFCSTSSEEWVLSLPQSAVFGLNTLPTRDFILSMALFTTPVLMTSNLYLWSVLLPWTVVCVSDFLHSIFTWLSPWPSLHPRMCTLPHLPQSSFPMSVESIPQTFQSSLMIPSSSPSATGHPCLLYLISRISHICSLLMHIPKALTISC